MGTATSTRVCSPLTAACLLALIGASAASGAKRAAPVNTVSPMITGTPRVGADALGEPGRVAGLADLVLLPVAALRPRAAATCTAIDGAVAADLRPDDADLGKRIRVEVVAAERRRRLAGGRSAATAVIKIPAPSSTARPKISGDRARGPDAEHDPGHVDRLAELVRVPVEALHRRARAPPIAGATASTYLLGRRRRRDADPGAGDGRSTTAAGARRSRLSTATRCARRPPGFELGRAQARPKARPGAVPGHGPGGRAR